MRNLKCLNTIITDNLAVHIDISDSKSWNLNTGYTVTSLTQWNNAISEDVILYDFGLTGFDNGRARNLYDSYELSANDTHLKLYPIGYNNETGGTFYILSGITAVTASTGTSFVGNYFDLNGSWLQGFFKLEGFNHEILPARYSNGLTVETLIRIDNDSFNNGFIFYLGTRSEDKYQPYFSGETTQISGGFEGVFTSENNNLHAFMEEEHTKKAIQDEVHVEKVLVESEGDSTFDNVFGLQILSDQSLAFTKINNKGLIKRVISQKKLSNTGWNLISLVFDPYEIETDPDVLECMPNRLGTFSVFVNGRLFWEIEDFEEFYTKPLDNSRDKQIGVAFNISWGGGSFGLKHSYHYDYKTYNLYNGEDSAYVVSAFTENYLPSTDICVDNATGASQYVSSLALSIDDSSFTVVDDCGNSEQDVVMSISHTGQTGTSRFMLTYGTPLELISNREYVFSFDVYDNGIFDLIHSSSNTIGLHFESDVEIEIIESYDYNGSTPFEWSEVRYVIKTEDNSGLNGVTVSISVDSAANLYSGFTFYIDNFKYVGQDVLVQDSRKGNQLIEKHFSTSFNGSIQKLRIYDVALNSQEILHNAIIEAENTAYGIRVSKGGRLIYR